MCWNGADLSTADDRPASHRRSSTENIALSLTAFKEELEEIHWIKADVGNEDARLIQAPEAAVNIVQGLFLVCSHGKIHNHSSHVLKKEKKNIYIYLYIYNNKPMSQLIYHFAQL